MMSPPRIGAHAVPWILLGFLVVLTACDRGAAPPSGDSTTMEGMTGMAAMGSQSEAEKGIVLSQGDVRQFGITFGVARRLPLVDSIRAVGVIAWDETRVSQVTSRVAGFVETIHADYTGQRLRRGDTLFTLYSPELTAAGEELLSAAALARQRDIGELPGVGSGGTDLVKAARRRLEQWNVPESVIVEMLANGRVPRAVPFLAPSAGVVIEKQVQLGQAVAVGERLYTLADPDVVWVELAFREFDAARVGLGAAVTITLTGEPGTSRLGRISFVEPQLDTMARTVRARVELGNPGGLLRPGRYVAALMIHQIDAALTVPSSAVVQTGEATLVFRSDAGRFRPVTVVAGLASGGLTVILDGLSEGDSVVTSAQYLLEAESNLATAMRAMMGQMGAGAMSMPGGMPPAGDESMDGMTMPNGRP